MDCNLPGSYAHGIFQARVLEWGAIAFSVKVIYLPSNTTSLIQPVYQGVIRAFKANLHKIFYRKDCHTMEENPDRRS